MILASFIIFFSIPTGFNRQGKLGIKFISEYYVYKYLNKFLLKFPSSIHEYICKDRVYSSTVSP